MKTIQKTNSLKNLRNLMSLMSLMSLISLTPLHAQVRIGEDVVPTKGTVLDLSNTSDGYIGGLKLPNVSITDLNTIPTSFKESATITENTDKEALVGTVVYNTNTTTGAGIYCWNGTKWIKQTDATSGSTGGIPEAPQDDNAYIRKNGEWIDLFEREQGEVKYNNAKTAGKPATANTMSEYVPVYYTDNTKLKGVYLYKFGYTAVTVGEPLIVIYQNTGDITPLSASTLRTPAGSLFTITPTTTAFTEYLLDGSDSRVVIHNDKLDSKTGLLYIDQNTTMGFGMYATAKFPFKYAPVADPDNSFRFLSGNSIATDPNMSLQFTIITKDIAGDEYKDADLKQIELRLSDLENNGTSTNTSTRFKGKKISFIGDSITSYEGYVGNGNTANNSWYSPVLLAVEDTYWWKLVNYFGMERLVNQTNNGMSVAARGDNNSVVESGRATELHNSQGDPDIIVLYIGTGDLFYGVPLGTYNGTTTPPLITNKPTTFREAYAVMLLQIKNRYPKAHVYCCTIMGGAKKAEANGTYITKGTFPEKNVNGIYLAEYNQALREIATAYGCHVIDMAACGINVLNADIYMIDYSWPDSNGLHPNKLGMQLMYEQIRSQM